MRILRDLTEAEKYHLARNRCIANVCSSLRLYELLFFCVNKFYLLTKCEANKTCSSDLVLEGRVLHFPSEEGLDLNVVNRTSEVVLELTLTNKHEIAARIHLTVKIQRRIPFRFIEGLFDTYLKKQ